MTNIKIYLLCIIFRAIETLPYHYPIKPVTPFPTTYLPQPSLLQATPMQPSPPLPPHGQLVHASSIFKNSLSKSSLYCNSICSRLSHLGFEWFTPNIVCKLCFLMGCYFDRTLNEPMKS